VMSKQPLEKSSLITPGGGVRADPTPSGHPPLPQ
jgi:hypothetical protein